MGRSQNKFIKNQRANSKRKKRKEKLQRKIDKKDRKPSSNPDDMIAYVDDFGNILNEPPKKVIQDKTNTKNENE